MSAERYLLTQFVDLSVTDEAGLLKLRQEVRRHLRNTEGSTAHTLLQEARDKLEAALAQMEDAG